MRDLRPFANLSDVGEFPQGVPLSKGLYNQSRGVAGVHFESRDLKHAVPGLY